MGAAAVSLAALCLSVSTATFGDFSRLSRTIGRENAARQAMIISRAYFVSNLPPVHGHSEQSGAYTANPRPITEIDSSVFAAVAAEYPGATVEGVIIDLNYDLSFITEARRLGIPHGLPSFIEIEEAGGGVKKCSARRYELRTKVSFAGRPPGSYSVRLGLLVLTGDNGVNNDVITLYMEK